MSASATLHGGTQRAGALVACSRMYDVNPGARDAWHALFEWLAHRSGVALTVIDHAAPAPLAELWARPDLGCTFMCGWPFARAASKPRLLAAPRPSGERYGGAPIYFTDLVVRRDRGYRRLEDCFGGTVAWTAEGSHSGFNALRHHLLPFVRARGAPLFARTFGPTITPRAALLSVIAGEADIAPLDSFALDLIGRHEPDLVAAVEVIASTASTPAPAMIASHAIPPQAAAAITQALLGAHHDAACVDLLRALCLVGFSAVAGSDYEVTLHRASEALTAGYPSVA